MVPASQLAQQLRDALLRLDATGVCALLQGDASGNAGQPLPEELLIPALEEIGLAWERGQVSLSQVYMAGRMCEQAMASLHPHPAANGPRDTRLAIVVLQDHHALGKRMVKSALLAAGLAPLDYGQGLDPATLVRRTLEDGLDLLLISCLMYSAALKVRDVVDGLKRADSPTRVVVGGAPFRLEPKLWRQVGAHAMGRNSAEAVGLVQAWKEGGSW